MTSTKLSNQPNDLLIDGFINSARLHPDRTALFVENTSYSYVELGVKASQLAAAIQLEAQSQPFVGVLAHKSETAFAGILGSLLSGNAYVPFQPHHPAERTHRSIETSAVETIIVGLEAIDCLEGLIQKIQRPIRFLIPCADDQIIERLKQQYEQHNFLGQTNVKSQDSTLARPDNTADDIAYIIFTSGSTGVPKGVAVRNRNVIPFIEHMSARCQASHEDRFSQISDLTFDLSIFPVWTCWANGSCLCCVSDQYRLAPAKFIKDQKITVWTSVPSAVVLLKKMRLLKPDSLPSIRYSFFCGEALPSESAADWQTACPNSITENMYGPTEAACAFTGFRWEGDSSRCTNGIVPIGWPFPDQKLAIVDAQMVPVAKGTEGELCLSGSQVVDGYYKDPEKTAEKFIKIETLGDQVWYRTGDLAIEAEDGCHFFRGRADFQVKILGHRIELEEIEQVIRKATGASGVVCLAWPIVDGAAQGLVAFSTKDGTSQDEKQITLACQSALPDYMVPKKVQFVSALPLNPNGKTDRKQLIDMLEKGTNG